MFGMSRVVIKEPQPPLKPVLIVCSWELIIGRSTMTSVAFPDCNDGSDEVGCNIVSYHDNYNKEVTSNNEKSDLNTSVEIHNILSIDENRGKIRVTMRLILEWYDSRLTFMNLKIQKEFNVLSDSEYSRIWKPRVIYVNMETKDTEESLPPQITIHLNKLDTFSLANYNSLYSSRLYNGSNITIHWNRDFR
jgi:hypothetical protein